MRDHRFTWAYLFGATCPVHGVGAAIVMPEVNVDGMNKHLAEIGRNVAAGAIAVLVLYGADWHTSSHLKWQPVRLAERERPNMICPRDMTKLIRPAEGSYFYFNVHWASGHPVERRSTDGK